MSLISNPLQSTIFIPPNGNDDLFTVSGKTGNPAGYGTSQIAQFSTPAALNVGNIAVVQVTCPKPAPLWAISTETAADRIVIRTINNQQIQLQTPTAFTGVITGFNNGYFQPAACQTYLFYFIAGTAKAIGGECFELQAVIENTIGQYVDLGSISTTTKTSNLSSKSSFYIGTTVSLNTTSTLANTVYIDFTNWPVNAGRNVLATAIALLSSQANKSVSAGFSNSAGTSWEPITIVGGQTFSFEYMSQRDGYFTGRISIAISQVGVVTLSPTIACTAISQSFETRYTLAGDNSMSSQDIDSGKLLMALENLNAKVNALSIRIESDDDGSDIDKISPLVHALSELQRKNQAAHDEIFRQLARLQKQSRNVAVDDMYSLDDIPKPSVDHIVEGDVRTEVHGTGLMRKRFD